MWFQNKQVQKTIVLGTSVGAFDSIKDYFDLFDYDIDKLIQDLIKYLFDQLISHSGLIHQNTFQLISQITIKKRKVCLKCSV